MEDESCLKQCNESVSKPRFRQSDAFENFESEEFRGRVSFKMEATVMLPTPFQLFFFWATALGFLEHVCYQKDWQTIPLFRPYPVSKKVNFCKVDFHAVF